jgi:hypothetical protein
MEPWLRFLRSLPDYAGMHETHVIIDGCAAHLCDDVRALAAGLGICPFCFMPPGLMDILQPLDRAVLGALKAEYGAIYRYKMSQREDKSMTKADFAAYLLLARELVSGDAIHRGWECSGRISGCWRGSWRRPC